MFGGGSGLMVLLLCLVVVCFLFGIWFMIVCCTIGLLLGYRLGLLELINSVVYDGVLCVL